MGLCHHRGLCFVCVCMLLVRLGICCVGSVSIQLALRFVALVLRRLKMFGGGRLLCFPFVLLCFPFVLLCFPFVRRDSVPFFLPLLFSGRLQQRSLVGRGGGACGSCILSSQLSIVLFVFGRIFVRFVVCVVAYG